MNWLFLIALFIDQVGLVTLNNKAVDGPGAGNLLLHTGLYYVAAHKEGKPPVKPFGEVIKSSGVKGYPGLYWRSPYKIGDTQQHDDYIGIAAAYFYDQGIAREIVAHGAKYNWVYNSKNPEKFDITLYHDRFPGQVTFYKMSAGEPTSFWEALPVGIRALIMSYSPNGDSAIHSYLMFSVCREASPLVCQPMWWVSGFRKEIGSKFKGYLGKDHPLTGIRK